jgi:hypothetical protein
MDLPFISSRPSTARSARDIQVSQTRTPFPPSLFCYRLI